MEPWWNEPTKRAAVLVRSPYPRVEQGLFLIFCSI